MAAALALLAGAAAFSPPCPGAAAPSAARARAEAAATALQKWYDPAKALWSTTGWWNSANALESLIDYDVKTKSRLSRDELVTTFAKHSPGGFLNRYFDDEGWWALTWIKAYDLTGEPKYLDQARSLFRDMTTGWDETFGGGIWWSKDRKYKNAIANELFLTIAARLTLRCRAEADAAEYRAWALREWQWFDASGMINAHNLINDGLNAGGKNNGGTVWTYNQGVILGGLLALNEITGDRAYLTRAEKIADAAIRSLTTASGILADPCEASGNCGGDGPQFKGIFVRNLALLAAKTRNRRYRDFLRHNADTIWTSDRDADDHFGLRWSGPVDRVDAARQTSALDALNAAL